MRRAFLNYFSTWEVVLIIAILFTLFTFIIFACLHRFFPKLLINSSTHNVAGVFNILGISSITLAFTIVILWQYYIAAEEAVNNEATSLNEIIMFSQALPQQERAAIKENVGNYAKIVINDEWDKMKQGEMSTKAEGAINMLYQIIVNYHPKNENERIFFQKILDKYDVILHARDLRHQAIDSIIPNYFFAVLVINLFLLVISVCLLEERHTGAPLVITTLVALMAGTTLGLTISLDYPYTGDESIKNTPFTKGYLEELVKD